MDMDALEHAAIFRKLAVAFGAMDPRPARYAAISASMQQSGTSNWMSPADNEKDAIRWNVYGELSRAMSAIAQAYEEATSPSGKE